MKKLLALALMSVISVGALADDWKKLGERRVSFNSETDTIHVSGFKGKFDKIFLRVEDAPIRLEKIKVVFGNGGHQNFYIRKRLEKGRQTVPLRLIDGDRVINKIELNYRTAMGGYKTAEVKVYGLRS
ncbi:hypothetical protein GCM10023116_25760 [Kistimonas scapharcae]|uniref:Uncharacterized protein n=2 Tax=cellular organisms TaxID=131567 RepID=A0AAV4G8T3_9GAST|nr:MAG: hypothetical protein B0D91_01835 [Oceanospirillales bacterium LUC14_002_19_P2]GFR81400.1 hypothetical protein ElyMa_005924500 [Elysia marginata]